MRCYAVDAQYVSRYPTNCICGVVFHVVVPVLVTRCVRVLLLLHKYHPMLLSLLVCVSACGSVITQTMGSYRRSLGQLQKGVLSLLRGFHQSHVVCLCLGLCGDGCCDLLLHGFRQHHISYNASQAPIPCWGLKITSLLVHVGG